MNCSLVIVMGLISLGQGPLAPPPVPPAGAQSGPEMLPPQAMEYQSDGYAEGPGPGGLPTQFDQIHCPPEKHEGTVESLWKYAVRPRYLPTQIMFDWKYNPGDMYQHFPYCAIRDYYYFRPYNFQTIAGHQKIAASWGGDPRHPYTDELFRKVYADLRAERAASGGEQLPPPRTEDDGAPPAAPPLTPPRGDDSAAPLPPDGNGSARRFERFDGLFD